MALTPEEQAAENAGWTMPEGTDNISGGDDAIRANAVKAKAAIDPLAARKALPYIDLLTGQDLNDMRTPGRYRANNQTLARTILNRPAGQDQPFVCIVDSTSGGLISQNLRELYNPAGIKEYARATSAISPVPYPFGAWKDLTPASTALPVAWNSGAANELLRQDFTRSRGGKKATAGLGVFGIRFDHGLANTESIALPLCQARGIVPSIALISRAWDNPENAGVTPAIVDGWVAAGDVEIWNHGALGHVDATTPAQQYDSIVNGLSELRAQLPSARIDGWVVPGTGSLPAYGGFDNGQNVQAFYNTEAGRLILEHHAVSTGYITGTHQMILDGTVRQGGHQFTIDSQTLATFQVEVDYAIANGTGLQVMLHPSQIDLAGKITTATLTAMLDYVVAKRAAGELLTMSPYDMHLADSTI